MWKEPEDVRRRRLGVYYDLCEKINRHQPLTAEEQALNDERLGKCRAFVAEEGRLMNAGDFVGLSLLRRSKS